MRARALATIGAAISLLLAMSGVAGAASWHFETLDGNSTAGSRVNADVGQFTSTLLYNGSPQTFYRDAQNGYLRHAWWTGSQWGYEVLDGAGGAGGRVAGDVGTDVKAVIYAGAPHVFYYDVTHGDLRHAWWTGAVWGYETLDGDNLDAATGRLAGDVGTDLSVVNFGSGPHAFYHDVTNHSLRHAWWTGAGWARETLDGSGGAGGRVNEDVGAFAAAIVYGGPHVFYYDDSTTTLRHAWWTGVQWGFETLDGLGGAGGRVNESVGSDAAATVFGGSPHVWFYDIDKHALRHGWWNGAAWAFETLDGQSLVGGRVNTDVGLYSSLTIYGGTPHVFYRAEADGDLRHAWWTGSVWAFESLDGGASSVSGQAGNVGLDSSVTIYNGQPHTFYYDVGSGDLRHAWYA